MRAAEVREELREGRAAEVGRLPRAGGAARGPGVRDLELQEANRVGRRKYVQCDGAKGQAEVGRGVPKLYVNSLV